MWLGAKSKKGYGILRRSGKNFQAHRYAHELEKGPIPDGQMVLHLCDTPACVRPDHLFLGTAADNSADMVRKERQRNGRSTGARNGNAVLDEHDVAAIRADLAEKNGSIREIARRYGVGKSTVGNIAYGRTWNN